MKLTPVDPADYVAVIGTTFAKHEHAYVVDHGAIRLTRRDLARLGFMHPRAAAEFNRVLGHLRIRTLAGLARHAGVIGAYRGIGTTTYWLVIALLTSNGYTVHAIHPEPVTHATLKARARKAQQDQRKRKPRRAGPPSESASASVH